MRKPLINHPLHDLSEEQILLLQLSDDDIENERLITQKQLDKEDQQFFKLSKAQKKELDRRYNDYMNGVGQTHSWEETLAMTNKALAEQKNNK
jgi:putative addiction module component (TIGR02574 family)